MKEVNDFHEINHLQGKIHNLFLAVKFSTSAYHSNDFETALAYLMEVEEMFVKINQQRALGVIYNNRGNILRRQCESLGGEPDYSEALASFVLAVGNMRTYVKSATEAAEAGEHIYIYIYMPDCCTVHFLSFMSIICLFNRVCKTSKRGNN